MDAPADRREPQQRGVRTSRAHIGIPSFLLGRGKRFLTVRVWAVRETMRERQETGERESGARIIIPIPRPRGPGGPERGGGGFER